MIGTNFIKQNKREKGFTMVEMVVVMAIFLLIIGAAITIFLSIIQHQRIILSQQKILNQVSYVEEYMSKALRMAKRAESDTESNDCIPEDYTYLLTRSKMGYYNGIKFINQTDNARCTEFFLDDEDGILKELKDNGTISNAVSLTSSDLEINFIRFGINGGNGCYGVETCPDGATKIQKNQPKLTILLSIKIKGEQNVSQIIQTTISARNLNGQ